MRGKKIIKGFYLKIIKRFYLTMFFNYNMKIIRGDNHGRKISEFKYSLYGGT